MPATKATTLFGLEAVKPYCGVTGVDASADDLLVTIADAVSERMESATNRIFVTRAIADTYDGDGRRDLLLLKYPIASAVVLTIKDTADQVTPTPYVQGTDFDVNAVIGRLRMRTHRLTRGFQNVVATYSAGWGKQDSPTLPRDVYQAGLDYAKAVYNEHTTGAIAATSVSLGPSTFVLKPQLPYGIKGVLDKWRAVRL